MNNWACEYCGSTNTGAARKCLDCGASKPLREEKPFRLPDVQYNLEIDPDYAAAWANTFCGKRAELAYQIEEMKIALGKAILPAFMRAGLNL